MGARAYDVFKNNSNFEMLRLFLYLLPGLLLRILASLHMLAIFFIKKEREAEFLRKPCSSSWDFWESQQHPNKPQPPEGGVNLRDACEGLSRESGSGKEERDRAGQRQPGFPKPHDIHPWLRDATCEFADLTRPPPSPLLHVYFYLVITGCSMYRGI